MDFFAKLSASWDERTRSAGFSGVPWSSESATVPENISVNIDAVIQVFMSQCLRFTNLYNV